ncbi:hypothetical protein BDB00DRAFT_773595 [Zychaea mexicana]|uniref:uncharacterized protein n=1 Tax=Zychaea mexicana TaxID=64656 RepID=UPI0022FDB73B|nr:uncharacterized protein BDB00DRAFT_773595 [Zychaea mexicana]KAI9485145.1 hypothetical protein BDB00DRAFT_773595 [Zychaea mexicana]
MIPTFVSGRPTGEEKGRYLALDLGGTFLRVCEVDLCGNKEFKIHQQKYKVPIPLKEGDFRDLCDFIADCVDAFISSLSDSTSENGEIDEYQLGFTFSFPCFQTGLNRGVLKQWTKGYSCTNAVHNDVVEMLQQAFLRKQVPVNIAAIVNDTVGTLMALAYSIPETAIGVILGTGTNACYYEKLKGIKKWDGGETLSDEMVINTEWGAFDCERICLPMTIHDNKLDRESHHPRQQIFEKMISGMYLGEISRNVIVHLVDRQILFRGYSSNDLNKPYCFDTAYMSSIEMDSTPDLQETRHILEDVLSVPSTTLMDRQLVKKICQVVGRRAARLSACGLAAVLKQSSLVSAGCTIGIDGSLFEHYPGFESNMMQALKDMFGPYIVYKVKLSLARDGSGLGAAIIAMLAHKAAQMSAAASAASSTQASVVASAAASTVEQQHDRKLEQEEETAPKDDEQSSQQKPKQKNEPTPKSSKDKDLSQGDKQQLQKDQKEVANKSPEPATEDVLAKLDSKEQEKKD